MAFKVYPLIHSRLLKCDFNSSFLTRPGNISVSAARKAVLSATCDIDSLDGFRYVIAPNNDKFIIGMVGRVKDFILKSSFSDTEKSSLEEYSKDEKGRLIYCFLGYCCEINDFHGDKIPDVTIDSCLDLFKKYVVPKWEAPVSNTEQVDEKCIELEEILKTSSEPNYGKKINGKTFYLNSASSDKQLFRSCLSKIASVSDISLCTNINSLRNIKDIKDSEFKIVSTSENIIYRMEKETVSNTRNTHSSAATSPPPQMSSNAHAQADAQKKKSLPENPVEIQNHNREDRQQGGKINYVIPTLIAAILVLLVILIIRV